MYGTGRFGVAGGIVLLVALVLGAAAIGYLAYNAGVTEGVAQAAAAEALPGEAGQVAPYYYGVRGFRPFWPGSFLLFCFVVPFLFFLFFGVMKLVFALWRLGGRWRGWEMKGGPWRESGGMASSDARGRRGRLGGRHGLRSEQAGDPSASSGQAGEPRSGGALYRPRMTLRRPSVSAKPKEVRAARRFDRARRRSIGGYV